MEGQGVTNYAVNKPAYGYTTETTQFDDALIRHGVVTHQQAIMAKGATAEQAQALLQQQQQAHQDTRHEKSGDDDDDDSFLDDEEDEFMLRYRQERFQQIQQQQQQRQQQNTSSSSQPSSGQVYEISRQDWNRHVNEASNSQWVLVHLTSSDTQRTGCMERAVHELAPQVPSVKFVHIPATQAVDQWPHAQLPTIFAYRHGSLQHTWAPLPVESTADDLALLLQSHGIGSDQNRNKLLHQQDSDEDEEED